MTSSETPYDPTLVAGDADGDWDDTPIVPRARMPRPTKLLLVLVMAAAAFAGGIFAQRHWGKSTGSGGRANSLAAAGGLERRFGASGNGRTGSAGAFGGATVGQVAYLSGSTLYVTGADGNTIKVAVPKGTTVTKSVTTTVRSLRPGDTVVIRGRTGKGGTVTAESVSVGGLGGTFTAGSGSGQSSGGATGFGGGPGAGAPTGFGNAG